jgi:hypothetical protein
MTAPLRRAHRWIWILLAIINATVLVAAIAARRDPTPRNDSVRWEGSR